MGSLILQNLRTWVDGYDLTGDSNNATLDLMYEVHDTTVFKPVGQGGARARKAGLEDVSARSQGFWAAGTNSVDTDSFTNLGKADVVMTMSHDGAEGSPAYMMRQGRFRYSLFGETGKPAPFALDFRGTNGETSVARGRVAKTDDTDVSATGAIGTALNLGAVGATQFLYASLHTFTAGTTVTIVVESAPDNTFAVATTRITLGPITAAGGTWGTRVAGAISDTWYRMRVTAITGTFNVAGLIGIR